MRKTEFEIFKGIFRKLRYFEKLEPDLTDEQIQEIMESYECASLPEAMEEITARIIKHMEQKPEPGQSHIHGRIS